MSEHPEDRCQRCGGINVSWHAPSPLWNAVMRSPDTGEDAWEIVCPSCFVVLAGERGIAGVGAWHLEPHGFDTASLWSDADGRRWSARRCLWIAASPTDPAS